jgi:hypothetical protein
MAYFDGQRTVNIVVVTLFSFSALLERSDESGCTAV